MSQVSISVLFIVCQSVKIIPDMYEVFTCRITSLSAVPKTVLTGPGCPAVDLVPLKCPTTPLVDSIVDLSHLLLAINSSANVIIYTLRGMAILPGVNFINVLRAAFTHTEPKSIKRQSSHQSFFAFGISTLKSCA